MKSTSKKPVEREPAKRPKPPKTFYREVAKAIREVKKEFGDKYPV